MPLSKGATFHVPSSPPTEDSPVLSIRHLARRSPTGSESSLISLLFEKEDGAARSIQDFERTFSGARGKQRAHHRGTDESGFRRGEYVPACLPSDEGFGSSISTPTDKDLTRVFERALDLDSGLGSSITSESAKETGVRVERDTSEEDGLSVGDLIQGWIARCILMDFGAIDTYVAGVVNKAPKPTQRSLASEARSAIVRSISPMVPSTTQKSYLSHFARKKFAESVFQPILREDRFKFFHPLVSALSSRTNKTIKCLRDLEQSLVFEPLVSTILALNNDTNTYESSSTAKRLAVSHTLYRSFGEFSIQLVLDTFHHLSEPEQRRATDRPYDNGYFLDLVQQVGRLAAQVGAARRARAGQAVGEADIDEMAYSTYVCNGNPGVIHISHDYRDDEITVEGGISQTGHPAELVRWKKPGKGLSLRTNERYEAPPVIKRQRSNDSLDHDAERSMARRKKNAEPKITELRCSDKSCDKVFNRKCDLAKHEKTHSRPFKCKFDTCKYHEQGLPTVKELERHINDKHSSNPIFYKCHYCAFKTKRDSNCKQHMEKKHGWKYERVKTHAKSSKTPQQTPQTPSMSTPSVSEDWGNASVYGSEGDSNFTPYTMSLDDFADTTQAPSNPYHVSLFPPNPQSADGAYGYNSPELNFNSSPYPMGCSASATGRMNITSPNNRNPNYLDTPLTQTHSNGPGFDVVSSNPLHIDLNYHGDFSGTVPTVGNHSLLPQSRNPSISEISPMITEEDGFRPTQQVAYPADNAMSSTFADMAGLPIDDFDLFGGSGDPSMGPSTADVSSHNDTDFFSNEFSDSQLGRYINI